MLRLYEDDFATAVYRTLRAAHPAALTRSRSVTHLGAPAFAGAMMGRQILGIIPVERRVLLFSAVDAAGHPHLEGRTIAESFRPGAWRVLALDTASPEDRRPDLASAPAEEPPRQSGLVWDLHPEYVLSRRTAWSWPPRVAGWQNSSDPGSRSPRPSAPSGRAARPRSRSCSTRSSPRR
ncbi:hypothetical protein [Streptomyces sp. BF23-19]|uniref:hypothetical protein n=1 Tax=unclassified Streptomyces TaxID=2593676 RepID=UPI0034E3F738